MQQLKLANNVTGDYTLTVNEESVSGSFNGGSTSTATPVASNTPVRTGTPVATNTPIRTATPGPTNTPSPTGNSKAALTITSKGGATFGNSAFNVTNGTNPNNRDFIEATFSDSSGRTIKLSLAALTSNPYTLGSSFEIGNVTNSILVTSGGKQWGGMFSGDGNLVVTNVSGNVITFQAQGVTLPPPSFSTNGGAGTLDVSGTFTVTLPSA